MNLTTPFSLTATAAGQAFADASKRSIAIGDVDGDGDADVLVANPLNDNVALFLRNGAVLGQPGTGIAREPDRLLGAGDGPQEIVISDLDVDGDNDVAIVNIHSCDVTIYEDAGLPGAKTLTARPLGPSGRRSMAMTEATFGGIGRVVLHGGRRGGSTLGVMNDTREMVGGLWSPSLGADAPSPRLQHAAAFSATTSAVVLFGGQDINFARLNDTWRFNGQSWTRGVTAPAALTPRDGHAMFYFGGTPADAANRHKVFMFGGRIGNSFAVGQPGAVNQMWRYDPIANTWTQITPANLPTARDLHAMAVDPVNNFAMLFGGRSQTGLATMVPISGVNVPETRIFRGTGASGAWDALVAFNPSPTARFSHAMAYDPVGQTIVMFGGRNAASQGNLVFDDTWTFNGATLTWSQRGRTTTPPPARHSHTMAYDAARNRVVLYGGSPDIDGSNVLNDLWEWDGSAAGGEGAWTRVSPLVLETGAEPSSLVAVDLDGGNVDLLAGSNVPDPFNIGGNNVVVFKHDDATDFTFNRQTPLDLGSPVYGLAVARLSGPAGPVSVLALNRSRESMAVLGFSGGSLQLTGRIPVGADPRDLVVGDFRGAGTDDVIVANAISNDLSLFVQQGSGFGGPVYEAETFATGDGPNEVVLGDVNGDGRVDIVVAPRAGNNVNIYTQDRTGAMSPGFELPGVGVPLGVAVGDLNADGRADIAMANNIRTIDTDGNGFPDACEVLVYRQMAQGTFSVATRQSIVVGTTSTAAPFLRNVTDVAIGDVTGDGLPDLVVADAGVVLIYPQQPDGLLAANGTAVAIASMLLRDMYIEDVNTDGMLDIVGETLFGATSQSRLVVLTQIAGGTFAQINTANPTANRPSGLPQALGGAASSVNSYFVFTDPDATQAGGLPVASDNADPRATAFADLNGDGRTDAITTNQGDGSITIFLQVVTGTARVLVPQQMLPGAPFNIAGVPQQPRRSSVPRGVGVGDFNGDGRPDIVTLQADLDVGNVQLQTSGTGFYPAYLSLPGFALDRQPVFVAVGDVNGDGRPDVAAVGQIGNRMRLLLQR